MNSLEKYLAVAALLLASLALFVRNPKEGSKVHVDLAELARTIEREEDHVTVDELAMMLAEKRAGLLVIDLRDSAAYAAYHIPTAVRIGIPELVESAIQPADTVVLYSEGGIHAAQAWMLLAAKGHRNVFTLRGGLLEWKERGAKTGLRPSRRPDTTRVKPPLKKFEKEQETMRNVC